MDASRADQHLGEAGNNVLQSNNVHSGAGDLRRVYFSVHLLHARKSFLSLSNSSIQFYLYPTIIGDFYSTFGLKAMWKDAAEMEHD